MLHVAELYEKLVDQKQVRAIRRFNLRKYCRGLSLPPCGISFWTVDDVNFDYLQSLNRSLNHDKFWFQGGSNFPRGYWDAHVFGNQRRTEFIFLMTKPYHCRVWRGFFHRFFADQSRLFGEEPWPPTFEDGELEELRPRLAVQLTQDLIHFSPHAQHLNALAEFHLGLFLLTWFDRSPGPTTADIFDAFKAAHPEQRAQMTRIQTTSETRERLDEILFLMHAIR
ncbi:hypothetical protein SCOR_29275 [Sulfidibacter corallicola]|uniref:Uncharacterized protein n=1 Tax=Sulfidibacter corallicola TaxID=2818388 RepID=A0A8A4TMM2_SULCO|nr:hypothetical protein [Sulfidibacter corallicola]QTD50352.1 hypothetical protein J3U87_32610 [Sulfidibacter corallicola]